MQQIAVRQRPAEGQQCGAILLAERSYRHDPPISQRGRHQWLTFQLDHLPPPFFQEMRYGVAIFWYQSERSASQASICGHVRFSAPLPAMIPMWPPWMWYRALSRLPTFSITPSDWQGGVMWSASAITLSIFARNLVRSTCSPRSVSVPFISRFSL